MGWFFFEWFELMGKMCVQEERWGGRGPCHESVQGTTVEYSWHLRTTLSTSVPFRASCLEYFCILRQQFLLISGLTTHEWQGDFNTCLWWHVKSCICMFIYTFYYMYACLIMQMGLGKVSNWNTYFKVGDTVIDWGLLWWIQDWSPGLG